MYAFIQDWGLWLAVGLIATLLVAEFLTHRGEVAKRLTEVSTTFVAIIVAVIIGLGQSQYERASERRETVASQLNTIGVLAALEAERVTDKYLADRDSLRIELAFGDNTAFFANSYLNRAERLLQDPSLFRYGDGFFANTFLRALDSVNATQAQLSEEVLCPDAGPLCAIEVREDLRRHIRELQELRTIVCLQEGDVSGRLPQGALHENWTNERIWASGEAFKERTGCEGVG